MNTKHSFWNRLFAALLLAVMLVTQTTTAFAVEDSPEPTEPSMVQAQDSDTGTEEAGEGTDTPEGGSLSEGPETALQTVSSLEELLQAIEQAEAGSIDPTTAAEHADLFAEWAFPVAYTVGQIRRYQGTLYKCVQAHTSQADWTPTAASSLWSKTNDPAEEWPEWSQPVGAHDAYSKGAKVSHNSKHWVSTADANVWEPGVYGWEESTDGV